MQQQLPLVCPSQGGSRCSPRVLKLSAFIWKLHREATEALGVLSCAAQPRQDLRDYKGQLLVWIAVGFHLVYGPAAHWARREQLCSGSGSLEPLATLLQGRVHENSYRAPSAKICIGVDFLGLALERLLACSASFCFGRVARYLGWII